MFQFVVVVFGVWLLMIACDPQRAKGDAFFFSSDTGVECTIGSCALESPSRRDTCRNASVHGTKEIGMVQFSFRPPGADYLGF